MAVLLPLVEPRTADAPAAARASSVRPLRSILAPLRNGGGDPTTRLATGELLRAAHTPDGPGTLQLRWSLDGHRVEQRAWGPGADWMLASVDRLIGEHDHPVTFVDAHPLILRSQRLHPGLRIGSSGNLYHELLPTVLGQRITAQEAFAQWRSLCWRLGEPAPGPFDRLRLPPHPDRLAGTPSWALHPLGIERARAEPLIAIARLASHLWRWSQLPSTEAAAMLSTIRGVGEWTIGVVLASALGEPDAIAVGDYHLKNVVAWNLAGEPRATDERMLELLAPYRGQRGRAVRLIHAEGEAAPKFGPRQRIVAMHRW